MSLFVTGGTGFIGDALVRRLAAEGHAVTALARAPERAPTIDGVTWVAGDHARDDGLERAAPALARADAVAHLAAIRRDFGVPDAELHKVNVASGVELVRRATAARRMLLASSVAVYGHGRRDDPPTSEAHRFAPTKRYGESKVEAERAMTAAAAAARTPLVIARPGIVYGPGSTDGMVANLALLIAARRFRRVGRGRARANFLYVDELVDALVTALVKPDVVGDGGCDDFILTGPEDVEIRRFIDLVAAAVEVGVPRVAVPEWLARAAAWSLTTIHRLLRLRAEPFLTRAKVDLFTCDDRYDTSKARERLGFAPRVSLEEGLPATVDWLRQAGELG